MAIEIIPKDNQSVQIPYMEIFIIVMILQSLFDNYLNMRQVKVLLVLHNPLIFIEIIN